MTKPVVFTALISIVVGATLLILLAWSRDTDSQTAGALSSSDAIDSAPAAGSLEAEPLAQEAAPPVLASIASLPREKPEPAPPSVTLSNSKISIQTAVQEACLQAGFNYQWQRSYDRTQPDCRRYVQVDVSDATLEGALDAIVTSNGLAYRVEGKNVWLERAE